MGRAQSKTLGSNRKGQVHRDGSCIGIKKSMGGDKGGCGKRLRGNGKNVGWTVRGKGKK